MGGEPLLDPAGAGRSPPSGSGTRCGLSDEDAAGGHHEPLVGVEAGVCERDSVPPGGGSPPSPRASCPDEPIR